MLVKRDDLGRQGQQILSSILQSSHGASLSRLQRAIETDDVDSIVAEIRSGVDPAPQRGPHAFSLAMNRYRNHDTPQKKARTAKVLAILMQLGCAPTDDTHLFTETDSPSCLDYIASQLRSEKDLFTGTVSFSFLLHLLYTFRQLPQRHILGDVEEDRAPSLYTISPDIISVLRRAITGAFFDPNLPYTSHQNTYDQLTLSRFPLLTRKKPQHIGIDTHMHVVNMLQSLRDNAWCSRLSRLHMSACGLDDKAVTSYIAPFLAETHSVRILVLNNNTVGNSGASSLWASLHTNRSLVVLSLDGNPISLTPSRLSVRRYRASRRDEPIEELQRMLAVNISIMQIRLGNTGINASHPLLSKLIQSGRVTSNVHTPRPAVHHYHNFSDSLSNPIASHIDASEGEEETKASPAASEMESIPASVSAEPSAGAGARAPQPAMLAVTKLITSIRMHIAKLANPGPASEVEAERSTAGMSPQLPKPITRFLLEHLQHFFTHVPLSHQEQDVLGHYRRELRALIYHLHHHTDADTIRLLEQLFDIASAEEYNYGNAQYSSLGERKLGNPDPTANTSVHRLRHSQNPLSVFSQVLEQRLQRWFTATSVLATNRVEGKDNSFWVKAGAAAMHIVCAVPGAIHLVHLTKGVSSISHAVLEGVREGPEIGLHVFDAMVHGTHAYHARSRKLKKDRCGTEFFSADPSKAAKQIHDICTFLTFLFSHQISRMQRVDTISAAEQLAKYYTHRWQEYTPLISSPFDASGIPAQKYMQKPEINWHPALLPSDTTVHPKDRLANILVKPGLMCKDQHGNMHYFHKTGQDPKNYYYRPAMVGEVAELRKALAEYDRATDHGSTPHSDKLKALVIIKYQLDWASFHPLAQIVADESLILSPVEPSISSSEYTVDDLRQLFDEAMTGVQAEIATMRNDIGGLRSDVHISRQESRDANTKVSRIKIDLREYMGSTESRDARHTQRAAVHSGEIKDLSAQLAHERQKLIELEEQQAKEMEEIRAQIAALGRQQLRSLGTYDEDEMPPSPLPASALTPSPVQAPQSTPSLGTGSPPLRGGICLPGLSLAALQAVHLRRTSSTATPSSSPADPPAPPPKP